MKKLLTLVLAMFLLVNASTFALEGFDDLPGNEGKRADEVKKENTTSEPSKEGNNKKGWAIGIEGGYNWGLMDSVYGKQNYYPGEFTGNDSMRFGINIASGKKGEGLPKKQNVTSIGFIIGSEISNIGDEEEDSIDEDNADLFDANSWGMYFETNLHTNKQLGKGTNYFYSGIGTGLEFALYDDDSVMGNRYDVNWKVIRVPIGFKFLIKDLAELFVEGSIYAGVDFSGSTDDEEYLGNDGQFTMDTGVNFNWGTEVKGGVRFWF